MWNQWSSGPPPLPSHSLVNSGPLIGPVQPAAQVPNITPAPTVPGVQTMQTAMYPTSTGAPSYTAAQFAAMTPDQQYAVQQHWQQWQAYEQQYAQWHAQYGEQYKREMEAMHAVSTPAVPIYNSAVPAVTSSFNYPPPNIVNAFPNQQPPIHAPPPPPPEETTNLSGIKVAPHIYEQPPPPPPPPQTEEKRDGNSDSLPSLHGSSSNQELVQNQDIRWSQPPPNILHMQGNRWSEIKQPVQSSQCGSNYIGRESRNCNRNRVQNKNGKNFENCRRQQLNDTLGVNNQLDNKLNNRTALNSNRFGNLEESKETVGPQWNQDNITEQSNVKTLNSQTNRTGAIDEKTFDEQFRLWEEQFENWKKENANHPDRRMYMQYEEEFEKTRVHLLERREQMRRRKMLENQQKLSQFVSSENKGSMVETVEKHDGRHVAQSGIDSKEIESVRGNMTEHHSNFSNSSEKYGVGNEVFKKNEITELFKSASGIPGLDLVEGKDEENPCNTNKTAADTEIIDLDRDNEGYLKSTKISQVPIKIAAPILSDKQTPLKPPLEEPITHEQTGLFKKKIPSLLDIVVERPHLSPETEFEHKTPSRGQSPLTRSTKTTDSRTRSISGDRDLMSPGQQSVSSLNKRQAFNDQERLNESSENHFIENRLVQEQGTVPQNVTEIAKALQDPNVMQLLSVALAHAQQPGGMIQSTTSQQSQLLQQLQQLQPLIQLQQDRNRFPQIWNNQQSSHESAWQNQHITVNPNPNAKTSSWSSNPFNRNVEQKPINRGLGSGNDSDGNNDIQQRNPRNPFRRSIGTISSDTNGSRNQSFGSSISQCSFEDTCPQQHRGINSSRGVRFDNNRPHSNNGMSLGFRNNPNNFGDRGGDDECYRPAQVFEYQNRSRADAIVPPTKIVDYGHRPSPVVSTNSFNRDNSEFIPVKTIDYGHASSSVQVEKQFLKNNEQKRILEQQNHTQVSQQEKNTERPLNTKQITSEDQNLKGSIGNDNDGNYTKNKMREINVNGEYPKNKWVLQNPETRKRPGPPTKRGKRENVVNKQKHVFPVNKSEYDELEENFEEISDNEDLNETDNNTKNDQEKVRIRPLFPSVKDSITSTSIVFPSIENNNTIPIDEILFKPGRLTRPKNIVIIIRGPPGSGKSHVAKLIKDKEVEMGGTTPRLLSIDDYFMIENDYVEKCPKSGRKIPKKEILYEYEKEMEDTYMQYLIKSFKKTISDHLFDFIIVDCCNQSLRTFNEFYNAARDGNFSPFVVDMKCEIEKCLNQNIHNRSEEDIRNIIKNYQDCPGHYIKLDVSNLLENIVEMEDVSDLEDNFVADSEPNEADEEEEGDDINDRGFLKSKWDTDPTTENLARLDGTSKPISKRGTATLEEYLQIDGWEPPPSSTNGKKRVRWADIEEKRAQEKMRAIGFVVGQTDWSRMMDPTSGSGALTKTKYIERLNRRR